MLFRSETAEEALRRELREELMIESVELTYFTSPFVQNDMREG